MVIDPSGIYFCVVVRPNQDLSHKLVIGEITTGKLVAHIASLFEIECVEFSQDGKYIVAASSKGTVSVWKLSEHLLYNLSRVLELI